MPEEAGTRSHRFPSRFRLKRRRLIRSLFDRERGDIRTIRSGCVSIRYRRATPEELPVRTPLQVAFAVGRRTGRAVVRNRIRRLLRETFRLHQHLLLNRLPPEGRPLIMMIFFRGTPERARTCIREDLPRALEKLAEQLAADHEF